MSRSRLRKRSVLIAGHKTSVSLEDAFWQALKRLALAREQSLSQLIAEVDRGREGNLSSTLRVLVLESLERR
ncbi:MAG: ribbon-helix-helix domain-containing protein [Proteobacteria bacterium]|nr:ribbon-helix-helix domain-containing protein [Pseudomonadota bacterium]MBI3497950.1 ribbon-helix-helix domain-containing protein [Pseudomonadota bacterium]